LQPEQRIGVGHCGRDDRGRVYHSHSAIKPGEGLTDKPWTRRERFKNAAEITLVAVLSLIAYAIMLLPAIRVWNALEGG
jgi:hypothetical protein